jgi:hypothetical protein
MEAMMNVHQLVLIGLATVPMLGGMAAAQEQVFRNTKAVAGKQTRVGIVGNVTQECTPGPMPEVKMITTPKNGTLAIRTGTLRAGSLKRCPELAVPVRVLFYQAYPTFSGTDELIYEVKHPTGKTQTITTKIDVGAAQTSAPAADTGADL